MSEIKNLKELNKIPTYAVIGGVCVVIFLIQLGVEGYVNIKNIYKGIGISTIQVMDAHQHFLLFRDLCSATLVMFLCACILKIITINGLYIKWGVLIFLCIISLLLSVIARYYGNRMVTSAVAACINK